jgi:AAA+ superfamily predicted ATPase
LKQKQIIGAKMKKLLLILWSLSTLSLTPQELEITKIQQELEQVEEQQKKGDKRLSNEVVASLIEHSPPLIRKYVEYLTYSGSQGEVKPKTLFLHGPSGVGKTDTAIALAMVTGMSYTVVHGGQLGDKYQNSAKTQLQEILNPIIKADQPHVIIIDECMRLIENYNDEKGSHEDNSTATAFWDLLDQCVKARNILFIATANTIERCPKMVKTRFGSNRFVEFKMPDVQARRRILNVLISKKFSCSNALLDKIASELNDIPPRDYKYILESAELNIACENKGRSYFKFEDFRIEIDRCKALSKRESFYDKAKETMENAKKELINQPIDALWKLAATLGSAAAGATYVVGKYVERTASTSQTILLWSMQL